jgi:dTMP kinase
MKGRLITLEGGEGAGKSTAVETIRTWLESRGRAVTLTREPGGTVAAEKIREILLDPATGDLEPITELLLMFAARAENLARVIRPALAAGRDVICDRFTDASMAYQGGGRELGREPVESLASLVHPDLEPDLTLLLDIDVTVGKDRIRQRGNGPDRFEQTRQDFLERVRVAYLDQAGRAPERFVVIDAGRRLDQVQASIEQALAERLA